MQTHTHAHGNMRGGLTQLLAWAGTCLLVLALCPAVARATGASSAEAEPSAQLSDTPVTSDDESSSEVTPPDGAGSLAGALVPGDTIPTNTQVTDGTAVDGGADAPTCHVEYEGHVERIGWQDPVRDGALCGTQGEGLRMEGLAIRVLDAQGVPVAGAIQYRAHVEGTGWQGWASDGSLTGTTHQGLRVEALMVRLTGDLAERYDVYYRMHVQDLGWLAWACNGEAAGSAAHALRVEAIQVELRDKGATPPADDGADQPYAFFGNVGLSVAAHVASIGWMAPVDNGAVAGTTGCALQVEALTASVDNLPFEGDIRCRAHVAGMGWTDEVAGGAIAGTTGRGLQLEGVALRLTAELALRYDVYYRVHVCDFGWLGWASDGAYAGTSAMAKRVEALQVMLVAKGDTPPSDDADAQGVPYVSTASVAYGAATSGGAWSWAADGDAAGSTGKARPINGMSATASSSDGIDATIAYAVSSDGRSWTDDGCDGTECLASGNDLRAVRLTLGGTLARFFDLYYRVHLGSYGWEDWACNGNPAGNADYGLGIEALQVRLVPKGMGAPGETHYPYLDRGASCIGQLSFETNETQQRVVRAARMTPSPGAGLCAAWVEDVIANAWLGRFWGDACDLYDQYCLSSDLRELKVGMIVAVSRHSHTVLGRIYGHVGIYVGDGMLMDNVGVVRTVHLDEWMAWYGDLVPVRWGWLANQALA